jgi:outer membrane protein OmpA-like peptidoglycan-associated protein
MEDHFVEDFDLSNGDRIKRDGFNLYFYKFINPMDKKIVLNDIKEEINDDLEKDLDIQEKEEGISITINNLKFKPNSTELLSTEISKVKELADMLKKIPERSFMIIGHTALAGTEEARMKLSLERALTIAGELIEHGVPAKRIFYAGKGATEPVAPNDTEENMKKNRRVEIIIMED